MKFSPTIYKLSNGLTVILDPMDIETVNAGICVHVGSRNETPELFGISHFVEHMLCKGVNVDGRRTPQEMKDYLRNFGGMFNANTTSDRTFYCGRIIAENFEILTEFLSQQLTNSLLDVDIMEREKTVVLQELKMSQDNPINKFWYYFKPKIWGDSGYGHKTLGTAENIQNFTINDVKKYLETWYSASNMFFVASGKLPENALEVIEKYFSKIPSFDIPETTPLKFNNLIEYKTDDSRNQTEFRIIFKDEYKSTEENRYVNSCQNVFFNILSNRLVNRVRYENGLVYGISAGGGMGDKDLSFTTINTKISPERLPELIKNTLPEKWCPQDC